MSDKNFLKVLADKRGCTVAAMLAVATSVNDGKVPENNMQDNQDREPKKEIVVEQTASPLEREPDMPLPDKTVDFGRIAGLNIPETQYPDKIPVRDILNNQTTPEDDAPLSSEEIKELEADGKELHYEICSEAKEDIKMELDKINSGQFNEAERDSMLTRAYTSAQGVKTSKFFNLDFVSDIGNGMLTVQKSLELMQGLSENPSSVEKQAKEIKGLEKESRKLNRAIMNKINSFKKDFDFETMNKFFNGELDRKAIHKSIDSALSHAESYCDKIDKKEQKKELQEEKAIKKDVDTLFKEIMQQKQR